MFAKPMAAIMAFAALAGCDAATQIAGDAVQAEARNAVTAQCSQVAEGAGIVAGRVAAVCECAVQTFVADANLTLEGVSRARIQGIVNQCAVQTGAATADNNDAAPTENIGG